MCGRFTLRMPWSELVKLYRVHNRLNLKPRYNIAPTQDLLVIRLNPHGEQEAVQLRWGLLPFWATLWPTEFYRYRPASVLPGRADHDR